MSFDDLKWSCEFGQCAKIHPSNTLNSSGHHNSGNKVGLDPIPWGRNLLSKPFKETIEILETKWAQTWSFPIGDLAAKAQSMEATARGVTMSTARAGVDAADQIVIESQSAPQSLPGLATAAPAPVIEIGATRPVILVPPVTVQPIVERHPLTAEEKNWLLDIMQKRALSTKDVMDELGLPRLNTSIWMSVHQGVTVSTDVLKRLTHWFDANAVHIEEVA